MKSTKIDYVTLAGTGIGFKFRRGRLDAKTLLWQTQVHWLEVRFPHRFLESRRDCHRNPFETW